MFYKLKRIGGILSILIRSNIMNIGCIVQKMVKGIKDNILLTKGVYAVLGNLIYSIFFFVFTEMY